MKEYLFKYAIPVKRFAADLGVSASYLYQLLRKERKPSLELALKIEKVTKGELSAEDLLEDKKAQIFESLDQRKDGVKEVEEKVGLVEKELKKLKKRLKSLEKHLDPSNPAK